MNRALIEASVTSEYRTIGPDGGIRMPSVPPAAIVPIVSGTGYPTRAICGAAIAATVRAVVAEDPEIAAKTVQHRTVAIASPPGSHPTTASRKLNRSSTIRVFTMTAAMKAKSGMATSR